MTIERRADLVLPAILDDLAGNANPDYIDDVLVATARMRQRRASASIQRWLPLADTFGTSALGPRLPWRALAIALIILALLVASLGLLAVGARKPYAPPFGLARTGLVTFVSGDDIFESMPDGSGPRPLIIGDGLQWGLTWSHRGDRFAYWSATPTINDPASLWVADRDGSNRHQVSREPVVGVDGGGVIPAVSWSPDDRQLAFSREGVLFLVNADGTDLHPIGDQRSYRSGPVWSPDGTLIAYTSAPFNDQNNLTSLWVMTPDGLIDRLLIPAGPGDEDGANGNASWSPDSRSLLVHTGGGDLPNPILRNSITIAQRDAAGQWSSPRLIVSGDRTFTWNYLPAWSNSGTRITFLRAIKDVDGPPFVVMVADADGSNVQRVSTRYVDLAAPCWTPDDRYIRAVGLASGGDRTILLLPLDGTAPVEIPAAGDGPSVGCSAQRLSP